MNNFYFNAAGAPISQAMIGLLMMRTGLQWEMHPAQVCSLEFQIRNTVEIAEGLKDDFTRELMPHTTGITLMGIPIVLKEEYPMNLIRLMYNGEEVSRIEFLAIPCGFGDTGNFDEWRESEHKKLEAIGYRRPSDQCGMVK